MKLQSMLLPTGKFVLVISEAPTPLRIRLNDLCEQIGAAYVFATDQVVEIDNGVEIDARRVDPSIRWGDPVVPTEAGKTPAEADPKPYIDAMNADISELAFQAGVDEVTLLTPKLAREVLSTHRPKEVNMSTEAEALERVRAERDLIRRIDENVFQLLQAGHDFSPAGLLKNNRTSLAQDSLVGRTPGPPVTHELTEAVLGDIVWDEPDIPTAEAKGGAWVALQPYRDGVKSDLEDLSEASRVNVMSRAAWYH